MRVIQHARKPAVGLCTVLVAVYLAAPFCPLARAQTRGCCDPATGCGAGAGLSAPDCCQLDAGRSGAAQHPVQATTIPFAPPGRSTAVTAVDLPAPPAAGFVAGVSPCSTGDPPPLYILNASLLR